MIKKKRSSVSHSGKVRISDEVVSRVAYYAAKEIEGVSGINGVIPACFNGKFLKKGFADGISVKVDENSQLKIDISIAVRYGTVIPVVCKKVQEVVLTSVRAMTGLKVGSVNVQVTSVVFDE